MLSTVEFLLKEIRNRFTYHPPSSPRIVDLHGRVRTACGDVAEMAAKEIPNCRELAAGLTKLEEASFWFNAAIARNHSGVEHLADLNAERDAKLAEAARSAPIAD